ncbi:MAG: hypothetical protein JWO06_2035 [Bacteroidota bacterium]|nr:hypothetical protein [Bacteroidota bacterium]
MEILFGPTLFDGIIFVLTNYDISNIGKLVHTYFANLINWINHYNFPFISDQDGHLM